MNLHDLFKSYPTAQIAIIAEKAGTSLGYLRGCRYGQRRVSADLALWLEYVTDGELTAHELRPDLPWPERRSTQPSPSTALEAA